MTNYNDYRTYIENSCWNNYIEDSSEEEFKAISEKEFNVIRKSSEDRFTQLQQTYAHLFNLEANPEESCAGVIEESYAGFIDVDMDEIKVEYSKDCAGLYTRGVAVCLAVMARATGKEGPCIALSHAANVDPEELLIKMSHELKEKGCDEKTIQFYIIGGQLPFRDYVVIGDSIETEEAYLALSAKYPIAGVKFNIAEGLHESLNVAITTDEIVWELLEREIEQTESDDNDNSLNERKRKFEGSQDEFSDKKPRKEHFEGLPNGQFPNFV